MRRLCLAGAVAAIALVADGAVAAEDEIGIGYAVSETGPNPAGAGIQTIPSHPFWIHDQNAPGANRRQTG